MRVVSLCPSLTELVFALGRGSTLVGRSKFCIHPAPEVADVPALGGTKNPHVARVVALRPDLVLLNEEENRREDAEALAAAGVPLHVSFPKDALQTAAMVRDLGRVLDAVPAAEAMASDLERRAAAVRARAAARLARGAPPARFAYLIWRRPWMAVGGDTFVSAMLAGAGGVNALADRAARYPEVTAAELAAATPDRVLLSSEPFPFAERHADELAEATGLPRARFVLVDGELLSWHGARTAEGVEYAERLLAFPTPSDAPAPAARAG
jgi:ABC-type Fe3+-hydroxamate transport system substrate-binding protein